MINFLFFLIFVYGLRCSLCSYCYPSSQGYWSIGLYTGHDLFNLHSIDHPLQTTTNCTVNPIISCQDIADVPASYVSKPFLFIPFGVKNDWYIFFEVRNMDLKIDLRSKRSQIGCAISKDQGKSWKYLQVVLKEEFSLSYPQVFLYQNEFYLIPQGNPYVIYKASNFPTSWKFFQKVQKPFKSIKDGTIISYKSQYYMFATYQQKNIHQFLHIYYAQSPLGPWENTPNNCIMIMKQATDKRISCKSTNPKAIPHGYSLISNSSGIQSGGKIFLFQQKLYRIVKNSFKTSIDLYEITKLSISLPLEQRLIPSFGQQFLHNKEYWNSEQIHHIDLTLINQGSNIQWIALLDGNYYLTTRKKVIPPNDLIASFPVRCSEAKMISIQPTKYSKYSNQDICFVSASSEDHFLEELGFIQSIRRFYPCNPIYVYNIGLEEEQARFLHSLPNTRVLYLNSRQPYILNNGKLFKAILIYQFLLAKNNHHSCSMIFYGDSSVRINKPFDEKAMKALFQWGLVVESPMKFTQNSFTHPQMYEYFNRNRNYSHYIEQLTHNILYQTQSGLMLLDLQNKTIQTMLRKWFDCAEYLPCILPEKNILQTKIFPYFDGSNDFRAPRDDQSAFTFLLDDYFGHGINATMNVFLNQEGYTLVQRDSYVNQETISRNLKNITCEDKKDILWF